MSSRVLSLALAFINGIAALQLYRNGMEWLAIGFVILSVFLLAGIDDTVGRQR